MLELVIDNRTFKNWVLSLVDGNLVSIKDDASFPFIKNEIGIRSIFMKQLFLVEIDQDLPDGESGEQHLESQLAKVGIRSTVTNCADYSEIELRSFQKITGNHGYFEETKTAMTQGLNGGWSKFTATSSVLYAVGK